MTSYTLLTHNLRWHRWHRKGTTGTGPKKRHYPIENIEKRVVPLQLMFRTDVRTDSPATAQRWSCRPNNTTGRSLRHLEIFCYRSRAWQVPPPPSGGNGHGSKFAYFHAPSCIYCSTKMFVANRSCRIFTLRYNSKCETFFSWQRSVAIHHALAAAVRSIKSVVWDDWKDNSTQRK